MVRKAFHSYARYWLETFRLARYGEDDLEEMVEAVGFDLIAKALRHGRGMVAITAHFGFYDLGLAWVGAHGYRVSTVAEVLKPRALFEWFAGERESRGWYVIPASPGSAALRRLLGTLRRGEIICLVGDRDLSRRGVSVCLFGEETTMPAGPSLMLAKTGAPLLLAGIHQIGPRRYRLEFNELAYERTGDETVDIPVIAQRIADAVEELVRRAPEQWHLFSTNWPSDEPHLPPRGRPGRR
jgi:KDO2-lipid IV(A) lauroyltransferase